MRTTKTKEWDSFKLKYTVSFSPFEKKNDGIHDELSWTPLLAYVHVI